MRTKRITLYYKVTQEGLTPPAAHELERKDRWVREVQKTVEAVWKPQIIRVTYELFNPEVARQLRFFNGTCIKYYAIQDMDLIGTVPDSVTLKRYREEILDEMLGYDLALVNRTVRRRKSTSDFKSVQAWNKFLNTLEETIFEDAGYKFPDSEEFWELVKEYGYEQAERMSLERLWSFMKRKNGTYDK